MLIHQPIELASPAERVEMIRKREDTKKFFEEMEANIKYKIQVLSKSNSVQDLEGMVDAFELEPSGYGPRDLGVTFQEEPIIRGRRVRTISALEGKISAIGFKVCFCCSIW